MKIHHFNTATSSLDVAWKLVGENRLQVFDSVLVLFQTEGRGQMRKHWDSPAGNLYAAVRLPFREPYAGHAGALAVSAACIRLLNVFGCQIGLKWPNDMVLTNYGDFKKCGGVLLEERGQIIIAGIGINLKSAPALSSEMDALPATSLASCLQSAWTPASLWREMVKGLQEDDSCHWHALAMKYLVWLDQKVEVRDGAKTVTGILKGLGSAGQPLVETADGIEEAHGSSMRLAKRALRRFSTGDEEVHRHKA